MLKDGAITPNQVVREEKGKESMYLTRPTYVLAILFGLLLALATLLGAVVAQQATPTADACAGAENYVADYQSVGESFEAEADLMSESDFENWTDEEFAMALAFLNNTIEELEALTPPPAAEEVHQIAVDGFMLFGEMVAAIEESGIWGVLPFLERLELLERELARSALEFELACEVAFFDHDFDGEPEIGLGDAGDLPGVEGTPRAEATPTR
jgi:hypothetical protein